MSNNREQRIYKDTVHLFLALYRTGTAKEKKCMRHVIKDEAIDFKILEAKCRALGGNWRIHKTVNARDCNKAMKVLQKVLIDHPEKASVIDSEWRTALLQTECKTTNYFMLDIDTQNPALLAEIEGNIFLQEQDPEEDTPIILGKYKTPKGWHYITKPFDTRAVCELEYVTLIRDGYFFIKEIKSE